MNVTQNDDKNGNEEEGADPVGPLASTEGGPIGARLVEGLLVGGSIGE